MFQIYNLFVVGDFFENFFLQKIFLFFFHRDTTKKKQKEKQRRELRGKKKKKMTMTMLHATRISTRSSPNRTSGGGVATTSSSSSSYSSSFFSSSRRRALLRKNSKRLNLKPKRTTTALFFNKLPLEDFEDDEEVKRGTQKEGNRIQSDWLDSSQELNLFNMNSSSNISTMEEEEERRQRRRVKEAKMKTNSSFFTTAEEQERIDFLSITSEEFRKARAFVEPEVKRGFAKNIFESATEMKEMMEEDDGGEDEEARNVRAANEDDERRRRRRRREEEEKLSSSSKSIPFVIKQVVRAFSYVTNAIVNALESVVPYQVPLTAIRWSVYGVWALLAVSSAQRFLVLLACTGGMLLLFGALNAGLNGVVGDDFNEDRYGSSDRSSRRRRRRRRKSSSANTKGRDFDANRKAYTRGSQYRTRSNPRWGKGENRKAPSTMNDELMDLEIPFTDFVSENLNRAAQFGGDALRDLGLSFDEDEENYSRARKPTRKATIKTNSSLKIENDNDGDEGFIDVTLEKQTQDSSSFTVGYREWLEESGTKNVSSSTKDIRASSTPIISNTEKEDETLSGDGIKNDEFVFKREEEKEEEKKDEMKATSAAYEADTISYDDEEDYDDDEIFFDYAEYDEEERNYDENSRFNTAFIEEEGDFIEPVVRRLRQSAGQSFNWFNEFLTGRFYGAFQEDRVEAFLPPLEEEKDEKDGEFVEPPEENDDDVYKEGGQKVGRATR